MLENKNKDQTIKYILEWQKRTKKQQRRYTVLMLSVLVVVFIVCVFFFFWFRNENYKRIVGLNMKYVQDSCIQEANQIEQRLNETVKQVNKFADLYTTLEKHTNEADINKKLAMLYNKTLFDTVSYATPDGTNISLEGECNISHREYFQRAMKGETGYEFIAKAQVTGKPILAFYSPVYENDEIIGVMTGVYEREKMDEMFSYELFNFSPDIYMLEGSGIVVANSNDENIAENLIEKLSEESFSGETDYEDIIGAIESPDRTSVSFNFVDDGKTVIGVIAQFKNSDWMLLSILPYDITKKMISNANYVGRVLMNSLITTFFVSICLFILILRHRYRSLEKEMSITTDNLIKTIHHDQKQAFIVESLSNTYSSIYYVDIVNRTYERFSEGQQISSAFPDTGKWADQFCEYVDNFVDEIYREDMYRYYDIDKFEETLGDKDKISLEYQRIDKDWRKAFMIPAERDEGGKVITVIFAVQKIGAEKKKELETQEALKEAYKAAQLANSAKTVFLSNMSHDIRTPMNAIIGMTDIAGANINDSEKVSNCLKKITSASKHLLGLINEVLDMSKIESGRIDLGEERFSLSELIDELILMNQPLVKSKSHTLIVKINDLIHENVIGDSIRLQQVFTNILTNAIKYTPENGQIEIIISEKNTNKPAVGWFEVVFHDNGFGMSEEFRKNIFEPFARADDDRISKIQGTGLGMPIARNIIRMMNGDITVESEIDKGSTFTVSFALKLQNEDREDDIDNKDFIDLPVLVVDDDESACESTCAMLDSLSMHSEWVTSGKQAIKKTVDRHNADDDYYALIIDWKMPDMDGVETTREIRKRVGDEIPIIVLTAYDWSEIEQEANAAGVNAFLSKPLFRSRLVNLFSGFMKKDHEKGHEYESKKLTDDVLDHDFTGNRILVAEDNELNLEIVTEILSMTGLNIETAENGKLCLEKFCKSANGYYDLIFMDIQMPVMNGYEATAAIRASNHPQAQTIPVIAMTANAFSTDVRAAYDAGMNGHISKPIDINNVMKTLEEHLK